MSCIIISYLQSDYILIPLHYGVLLLVCPPSCGHAVLCWALAEGVLALSSVHWCRLQPVDKNLVNCWDLQKGFSHFCWRQNSFLCFIAWPHSHDLLIASSRIGEMNLNEKKLQLCRAYKYSGKPRCWWKAHFSWSFSLLFFFHDFFFFYFFSHRGFGKAGWHPIYIVT